MKKYYLNEVGNNATVMNQPKDDRVIILGSPEVSELVRKGLLPGGGCRIWCALWSRANFICSP